MKILPKVDWSIFIPSCILIIIGLLTLFSLGGDYFRNQFLFSLVCIVLFFLLHKFDYRILKEFGMIFYIFSLIALAIIFIIGFESKGAVRWVEIFGVSIQFSELCKPLLAISLSSFLSNSESRSIKSFFLTGVFLAPIFLLIFFQPDLGNATIYALVVGIVLFTFGYSIKWFIASAVPFLLLSPLLWLQLHDYQRDRIFTFFNPASNPLGESYNVIQAVIAVGSGGIMGKGFGAGTQSGLRFLPERHTDFIFATLSEGLGFLGAMIVVGCFFFLLFRIYKVIIQQEETFEKIFGVCVFGFLLIHFFVNVGMNAGIVPVVGVTLPFVSLGGSSLLSNMIFLSILSQMSISQKKEAVLEIR